MNLKNKQVVVLGTGGAARVACYLVKKNKGSLVVLARNLGKANKLARELKGKAHKISDLEKINYDILINATPLGMFPKINEMPVRARDLKKGTIVVDIVYNPRETLLLKTAKKKGCQTVAGLDMFLYQAVAQVEAWQRKKVSIKFIKNLLTKITN